MTDKTPTYGEIWKTLSAVDVTDKIELKGKLSYLSWAWAWGTLMEYYPDSTYEFLEPEVLTGGTVLVNCKVTIGELSRVMWLSCMDFKMQACANPDANVVNKTKMRCLVKCLGMFGLGHYIYAGEDLPQESDGAKSAPKPVVVKEPEYLPKPTAKQIKDFGNAETLDEVRALYKALTPDEREICKGIIDIAREGLK
tara:strand:- start:1578 stop:2165 length:588 start_codon:yes stop_codon:yes gene_type:complete